MGTIKSWAGGEEDLHPCDVSKLFFCNARESSFLLWFQLPSLIRQDSRSYLQICILKKDMIMSEQPLSFLCYCRLVNLFFFWTRLIFVTKLNVRLCSHWRKAERVSKYNDRVSFRKTRKEERRSWLGTMEKKKRRNRLSHKYFEGKCISVSDWWTPQSFSHMALFMMSFIQLLYLNVSWNIHKSYWKHWYAIRFKQRMWINPSHVLKSHFNDFADVDSLGLFPRYKFS